VNDHVFRGAQPAAWGYSALAGLGIKTVVDLRGAGVPALLEEKLVRADGMNYLHIPLDGHKAPSGADIARLLAVLDDSSQWPVFVHCRRGADRTGTVMACYRMTDYHWDNDSALAEAMSFGMSQSQVLMRRYILQFHPDSVPGSGTSDTGNGRGELAAPRPRR
jgi:protein tyrosine/serine phosphatase